VEDKEPETSPAILFPRSQVWEETFDDLRHQHNSLSFTGGDIAIMNNDDGLINQVYQKIEREKVLINAARAMRQSSNPQVQQSLDAQIKEGHKNIGYLEERLKELRMRPDSRQTDDQARIGPENGMIPPRMPYATAPPINATPKARPNYSKLGRDWFLNM
jgi:hypothetical protein